MSLQEIDAERQAAKGKPGAGRPAGSKAALSPAEKTAELPKLAYSPREAAHLTGLSKTMIFKMITSGELPSKLIGKRRIIRAESINALIP